MGLDWNPINKPKQGEEKKFEEIYHVISNNKQPDTNILGNITDRDTLLNLFFTISTSHYETLDAPRVGSNKEATDWMKDKFELRIDKTQTLDQFIETQHGFYVLDLVPPHDGIPTYMAMHAEAHIFRAQFLEGCEDVIGAENLEQAYQPMLAKEAVAFGNTLMQCATNYAKKHDVLHVKDQRTLTNTEIHSPESKAHIVFSAAKWLLWWGEKGHGFMAEY